MADLKKQTAYDILAYLNEHEGAQDTLEGIAEWWLLEQEIMRVVRLVEEALDELVERGLVIAHTGADSQTHYRINKRKTKEIKELIARPEDGGE